MQEYIPFTYLIGWSNLGTFYYGRRTAKGCHPDDLWVKYFTSSKYVNRFRKEHGEPDVIVIRQKFPDDPKACAAWECKLLKRINAQRNTKFLNRSNGDIVWDTTGLVLVRTQSGETFLTNTSDPRYISGELVPAVRGRRHTKESSLKNTVTVKDSDSNKFRVARDDPRYIGGELVGVATGLVPVKDSVGNITSVLKTDSRYLSGELVHVSKGNPNTKCKNMVTVRGSDGNCFNVEKTDSRYISGELRAASKGVKKARVTKRGKDDLVMCPHCDKSGGERAMHRWHFDKCKELSQSTNQII